MKEVIITISIIVIFLSGLIGIAKLISWTESNREGFRQERKEKLQECLYQTDDNLEYCYDVFIK